MLVPCDFQSRIRSFKIDHLMIKIKQIEELCFRKNIQLFKINQFYVFLFFLILSLYESEGIFLLSYLQRLR